MPIPESEKTHNDLLDIIIEGSQTIEEVEQPDGKLAKQLVLDPETIWWKTHIVSSPLFAALAYEIKAFQHLAEQSFHFMHKERALVLATQIEEEVKNFRYAIDAKSSESLRDKNNSSSTLIDKINKNKIEKAYTIKGEGKRSLMDGILGREGQQEAEE